LSGAYSLWLFNRISYGNIKMQNIDAFGDMCYREFMILLPLGFLTIFLGIYPNCLIDKLHMIQIY
jgi:NADH-quinone oxidoreductase subunit M